MIELLTIINEKGHKLSLQVDVGGTYHLYRGKQEPGGAGSVIKEVVASKDLWDLNTAITLGLTELLNEVTGGN